jgi:flagellar hook-associated protein 2
MADGILGLGSTGAAGLSQELIDKLKAAEAKGKVDPYTTKLETWDKELEKITAIEAKVVELLSKIKNFDLYSSTPNAFNQVTASTTGTSAVFNAINAEGLEEGSMSVTISQLAQKDVYQTNTFGDKAVQIDGGNDSGDKISITVGGESFDFSTEGKTYQKLADEINLNAKITASIEQVGDNEYRMVVKSKGSGASNALTITQTGVELGLADPVNKTLSAQNMKAKVDGVDYDVSSNTITLQGNLTMSAVETGTSTIAIQKDNSYLLTGLEEFATTYNELVDLIDGELYAAETPISDLSTLRLMMGSIKNKLFASYGADDDKNIFNYGFSLDKTGYMNIDAKVFSAAVTNDIDGLKSLLIGTAEKPGLGTVMKEYLDELDGYDGLLTSYGTNMGSRKTKYEAEKTKAQELLDTKYSLMAQQFAAYTAMITQMEAAFGGMKMMIQQSTSSN